MIATFLTAFSVCLVAGVIPVIQSELYVLGAAAVIRPANVPALVLGATLGQMLGKSLLYFAGSGAILLPGQRLRAKVEAVRQRYSEQGAAPVLGTAVLLASATVGVPPFYLVSIACGIFRVPLARFLVIGSIGMLLRYSALVLGPQLVRAAGG